MRRLYVLRPEPGSGATVERARRLGLDARSLPLFEIRPLDWQMPDLASVDALLLTSANAVRCAGDRISRLQSLPAFAVGEATAAAAREAGLDVRATGDRDLRALLCLVPPGLRLLHLCGKHHTDAADEAHRIKSVPVYSAEPLPVRGLAEELRGQVAAVHSPRAAERLAELVVGRDRGSIRIAAISTAAAEAAGSGWKRVEAASEPEDSALLALAARLCKEQDRQ